MFPSSYGRPYGRSRQPGRQRLHGTRLPALLLLAAVAACGGGGDEPDPPQPPAGPQPASPTARVKFKGTQRMANDLAQGLDLSTQDLCKELGAYDCFSAHGIVLGGVEPYRLRIDEPLPEAPVTGPMAVDRVVLSACGERAARDFADPGQAVLFAEVAADAGAGGNAASAESRAAVARRLYERLLARVPQQAEIDALVAFGDDMAGSTAPARDWSQLACYAVATTTEFLFY